MAVAADFADAVTACSRSLRQMVRAGQPYALVPAPLASSQVLHYALDELIDVDGVPDGRFGNLCAQVRGDLVDGVMLVCLQSWCPARHEGGAHGWPELAIIGRAAAALADQTDPIARIERRALMALEGPSAFEHLAAGMPTA